MHFARALFFVSSVAIGFLGFPGGVMDVIQTAIRVFTILAGTWAAWNIIDLAGEVMSAQAAKTVSKLDDIVVPLIRKAAKIFIFCLGLVYAAQTMNVPAAQLTTGSGIVTHAASGRTATYASLADVASGLTPDLGARPLKRINTARLQSFRC